MWYWRQVLTAISTSTWNEIASYKLIALFAFAIGWASFFGLGRVLLPFYLSHVVSATSAIYHEWPPTDWSPIAWLTYAGKISQAEWRNLPGLACMVCALSAVSGCLVAVFDHVMGRCMLTIYFASRCVHAFATCSFFALGIIYVPQYSSGFLLLVLANIAAATAVIIPAGLFKNRSRPDLRLNTGK
jgi:hypothetical protein